MQHAPDRLKNLLVFHRVASALTSSQERDEILREIVKQLTVFLEPESWCLLLVDEEKKDLFYAVAHGRLEERLHQKRLPMGVGMAGWVAEHGETLIIPVVDEDPRFRQPQWRAELYLRSAVSLPLRSRGKTLGVMQLFNVNLEEMSDEDITFLHILCDYMAIAIDNARALEQIRRLSITDDLTGLYNGRELLRMLEQRQKEADATGASVSLIFADLDGFKLVNDGHGHLSGSSVLSQYGRRLRATVRPHDICFRYGGDEFLVLMPTTGKAEATRIAERVHEEMKRQCYLANGMAITVTASFGVATYPEDASNFHDLLGVVDACLYRAKNDGRDRVTVAGGGERPVDESVMVGR
jgi:diguanylate cyclase (GGDEF)-like protein